MAGDACSDESYTVKRRFTTFSWMILTLSRLAPNKHRPLLYINTPSLLCRSPWSAIRENLCGAGIYIYTTDAARQFSLFHLLVLSTNLVCISSRRREYWGFYGRIESLTFFSGYATERMDYNKDLQYPRS